jgi:hypothetical protein
MGTRKLKRKTLYADHPNGMGEVAHAAYKLQRIVFTSPQHMHSKLLTAMSSARLMNWDKFWMAQNKNGSILAYSQPPFLPNQSNPSRHSWLPLHGYTTLDVDVIRIYRALPPGVDAPNWNESSTPYAADFCNDLARFTGHMNREAEHRINVYRTEHPFAFAMRRITQRRAK